MQLLIIADWVSRQPFFGISFGMSVNELLFPIEDPCVGNYHLKKILFLSFVMFNIVAQLSVCYTRAFLPIILDEIVNQRNSLVR